MTVKINVADDEDDDDMKYLYLIEFNVSDVVPITVYCWSNLNTSITAE